jgi:hypothetical protein
VMISDVYSTENVFHFLFAGVILALDGSCDILMLGLAIISRHRNIIAMVFGLFRYMGNLGLWSPHAHRL